VVEALELVSRPAAAGNRSCYPVGEHVPVHAGLGGDWEPLVWRTDSDSRRRVVRMAYEVATFQALRERLRCKEIWVVGADRWRNPDQDLPADFDQRRVEHYRELRKPLDPTAFVTTSAARWASSSTPSSSRCPTCRGCRWPTGRRGRSS
jgi:hypothetical protein